MALGQGLDQIVPSRDPNRGALPDIQDGLAERILGPDGGFKMAAIAPMISTIFGGLGSKLAGGSFKEGAKGGMAFGTGIAQGALQGTLLNQKRQESRERANRENRRLNIEEDKLHDKRSQDSYSRLTSMINKYDTLIKDGRTMDATRQFNTAKAFYDSGVTKGLFSGDEGFFNVAEGEDVNALHSERVHRASLLDDLNDVPQLDARNPFSASNAVLHIDRVLGNEKYKSFLTDDVIENLQREREEAEKADKEFDQLKANDQYDNFQATLGGTNYNDPGAVKVALNRIEKSNLSREMKDSLSSRINGEERSFRYQRAIGLLAHSEGDPESESEALTEIFALGGRDKVKARMSADRIIKMRENGEDEKLFVAFLLEQYRNNVTGKEAVDNTEEALNTVMTRRNVSIDDFIMDGIGKRSLAGELSEADWGSVSKFLGEADSYPDDARRGRALNALKGIVHMQSVHKNPKIDYAGHLSSIDGLLGISAPSAPVRPVQDVRSMQSPPPPGPQSLGTLTLPPDPDGDAGIPGLNPRKSSAEAPQSLATMEIPPPGQAPPPPAEVEKQGPKRAVPERPTTSLPFVEGADSPEGIPDPDRVEQALPDAPPARKGRSIEEAEFFRPPAQDRPSANLPFAEGEPDTAEVGPDPELVELDIPDLAPSLADKLVRGKEKWVSGNRGVSLKDRKALVKEFKDEGMSSDEAHSAVQKYVDIIKVLNEEARKIGSTLDRYVEAHGGDKFLKKFVSEHLEPRE